ncbi:MAG: response regulator [Vicinamibacteria bacterium]|nr:response regulator [Vicinamibacteria bacterium]
MQPAFPSPLTVPGPTTKPTTVLVVDDDARARRLFERLLVGQGYVVETASDGPSALAAVQSTPPDVVVLDVMLPGVSGFEICRHLKRESTTRLTPVILVTGMNDRARRAEGLEAGADDFLGKPVDPSELFARVGAVARLKRCTDDLDSAAAIITTLAVMIEARNGSTAGRCHRIHSKDVA